MVNDKDNVGNTADAAPVAPVAPLAERPWRRKRLILPGIIVGAVLVLGGVFGGGVAVGASIHGPHFGQRMNHGQINPRQGFGGERPGSGNGNQRQGRGNGADTGAGGGSNN